MKLFDSHFPKTAHEFTIAVRNRSLIGRNKFGEQQKITKRALLQFPYHRYNKEGLFQEETKKTLISPLFLLFIGEVEDLYGSALLIGAEGAKTPAGAAGQVRPRRRFSAEEAHRPPRGKRSTWSGDQQALSMDNLILKISIRLPF
ncbi:hypothetical protein B1NLA3E_15055 [Bacillus sp. 1NLA3E]|nr:hypothetical protein B1NLA3E_15055 [Bacillus sp. 1NLA3E]